jgi:glucose-6-phosphate 1-dehydrogenase
MKMMTEATLPVAAEDAVTATVPDDHVIVVFGATGDLARRKLLPALFHLSREGLLPKRHRIIGSSRGRLSNGEFRDFVRRAIDEFGRCGAKGDAWELFSESLSFVSGGFDSDNTESLAKAVREAEAVLGPGLRRLFYLAVPPAAFAAIAEGLGRAGLTEDARVIMEKPFGTDLVSARALNATVHAVFDEEQVFRIDHFLGKETVQNILALRFANGMFEPVWNRDHVDHVQIDVPEEIGIGERAGFYEETGALRDMVVTHLFQVLAFVAMEPPAAFEPKALIDEKVKVFQAMTPLAPEDVADAIVFVATRPPRVIIPEIQVRPRAYL